MWNRIQEGFRRFLTGRYGVDQLGRVTLIASLVLLFVSQLTGLSLLWLLSLAGYGWTLFRMLSRNAAARSKENQLFLQRTARLRLELSQARVRFEKRKQYKYFKCPKCGLRMRLSRGCGDKTVTCSKCGHQFHQKA